MAKIESVVKINGVELIKDKVVEIRKQTSTEEAGWVKGRISKVELKGGRILFDMSSEHHSNVEVLNFNSIYGIREITETAKWEYWPGWIGNHDQRISGAKCSNCGYKHPTVYKSLDKLYKVCPNCGKKMTY